MRWMWIDRFTEFVSGSHATSIKNVSLSEEHLHDHIPGFPVMPQSLILEGLAQTGGILLGESRNFQHLVVLAKVPKMVFSSWALPGDSLTYRAKLADARDEGGVAEVTAHVGDRLVAAGEIVYAHADHANSTDGSERSATFKELLRVLEVGKLGTGIPTGAN